MTASDLGRLMTYANDEQRQAAADIVVPPGWGRTQLEESGDGFLHLARQRCSGAGLLTVDLAPIRQNLLDGGAADLVNLIWSTWPACTAEQSAQIETALMSAQSPPLTTCRPPQPTAGLFQQLMVSGLEF